MRFECRPERPWGVHPKLLNDSQCPRCGWTAPGPAGDVRNEVEEVLAEARALGWVPLDFTEAQVQRRDGGAALAA
jgi:hypothetical protein